MSKFDDISYMEPVPPQWQYVGAPACIVDIKLDTLALGLPLASMGYAPCNRPGRAFRDPSRPDEKVRMHYCPRHEAWGRTCGLVPAEDGPLRFTIDMYAWRH